MAAIAGATQQLVIPLGNKRIEVWRATVQAGNATESIAMGLDKVDAVLGITAVGGTAAITNVVLNATGTGQAEDSTAGEVGVESAAAEDVELVVIGNTFGN